jgi:hypothetical protein
MNKTNKTSKIGPNEKCVCGSDKKFKNCCRLKLQLEKSIADAMFISGHNTLPEDIKVIDCMSYLIDTYPTHAIINITKYLTSESLYKEFQTKNYYNKTIMVAERTDLNNAVFSSRSPSNDNSLDIIIMYQGAYRCFKYTDLSRVSNSLDTLINK